MVRDALLALAALGVVCGCARREHLTKDFGASYRSAVEAQAPLRANGPAEAVAGLDSQEAAIISDSYRAGLAPEGEKAKEEPVLIVTPPSRGQQPSPLAPSVPKG